MLESQYILKTFASFWDHLEVDILICNTPGAEFESQKDPHCFGIAVLMRIIL